MVLWLVTLWRVTWKAASRPVRSTSEYMAQLELLIQPSALTLTAILAATTVYYAYQTRQLVIESRLTREAEADAMSVARRMAERQRVQRAASALMGASSDLIATGSFLATALRARRVFRSRAIEPSMSAVVAATRAIDELRYLAPEHVLAAADRLLDAMLDFFALSSDGSRPRTLEASATRIGLAKQEMVAALAAMKGP